MRLRSSFQPARCNGFSLLEVLVASSLLAAGVLGLGRVQQGALEHSLDALNATRAQFLLQDMAERIRAGAGAHYSLAFEEAVSPTRDCRQQGCSTAEMVQWQLAEWRTLSEDSSYLPAGSAAVHFDVATETHEVVVRFGVPRQESKLRVGR
jgi:prepilin-type N-terminal cleavage/methylation domain